MSVTEANKQVQRLLNKYKSVSDKSLGTLRGVKAQMILEDGAQPKFCRTRNVPCAVKPYFEKELERLQEEGIISPIEYSPWASGVVSVAKRDTKDVRLCGDYKVTINPVIREKFPLPRVEDIFAKMAGGKRFSKIDLKMLTCKWRWRRPQNNISRSTLTKGCFSTTGCHSGSKQHHLYGNGQWNKPCKGSQTLR